MAICPCLHTDAMPVPGFALTAATRCVATRSPRRSTRRIYTAPCRMSSGKIVACDTKPESSKEEVLTMSAYYRAFAGYPQLPGRLRAKTVGGNQLSGRAPHAPAGSGSPANTEFRESSVPFLAVPGSHLAGKAAVDMYRVDCDQNHADNPPRQTDAQTVIGGFGVIDR